MIKNRSSGHWNGFFARRTRNTRLPIACDVAGIRVERTNREAPAPPEIIAIHEAVPSAEFATARTSLGQLIRRIVHAMRSGYRGVFLVVSFPEPQTTAPSTQLSRKNQRAKQRKAQATCCIVRSKQRCQWIRARATQIIPMQCHAAARKRASDKSHYVSYSHSRLRIILTSAGDV